MKPIPDEFMPEVLPNRGSARDQNPPPVSLYAPKHNPVITPAKTTDQIKQDLDELEKALAVQARAVAGANIQYSVEANRRVDEQAQTNDPIELIKLNIKKLTHRQMREVVEQIFSVRGKVDKSDPLNNISIARSELPDVLDRWAHGD
jgi:hypothetical protein